MLSACLFNPSPEDTDRVLHRFADHEVSFHDIADEFKTTVPALVLWLGRPDIAQRIADLRSAGAERTRTIAALYLPRTIPVLMRIIDSHDYDIGHRLDDPRDPATPILKLRERESVRKAITLIYRLANFTDKPTGSRAAVPLVCAAKPRDWCSSETPSQREGVGGGRNEHADSHLTTGGGTGVPPVRSNLSPSPSRSPDSSIRTLADPANSPALPPLPGDDSEFGSPCPAPPVARRAPLNADINAHGGSSFVPFVSSRSNPNTPSALLQRAGTNPRRSRAGPPLQEVA